MDQAAQEGAGGQHHGASRQGCAHPPRRTPVTRPLDAQDRPPPRLRRRSDSASAASAACMAAAIKLAVRLRARPAHRRPLAAVEDAELNAGRHRRRGPSARRAHRSRGRDGPCLGRRSPDCRTWCRWSRSDGVTSAVTRAHARSRSRSLTAGMAAAHDDDIERRSPLFCHFGSNLSRVMAGLDPAIQAPVLDARIKSAHDGHAPMFHVKHSIICRYRSGRKSRPKHLRHRLCQSGFRAL